MMDSVLDGQAWH